MPLPAQAAPSAIPPSAPAAPTPAQLPSPFSEISGGQLKAVRFPAEPKGRSLSPESAYVSQNMDQIVRAGVDFTVLPKSNTSVFFNPRLISKEEIHRLSAENRLSIIPEIKPTVNRSPKPLAQRSVHEAAPRSAPSETAMASPAAGAEQPLSNAPAQAQQPTEGSPSAPVKQNKQILNARVNALKTGNEPGTQNPVSVVDKLGKRAI